MPANTGNPRRRRLVRVAILVALVLGSMIVTVSVGAAKLWATILSWSEAAVSENEGALT